MKKIPLKKVFIIVLPVLVLGIISVFIFANQASNNPRGMRLIKSYNPNGICQSVIDPECGNCPGQIINSKCYVKNGEFEQYN